MEAGCGNRNSHPAHVLHLGIDERQLGSCPQIVITQSAPPKSTRPSRGIALIMRRIGSCRLEPLAGQGLAQSSGSIGPCDRKRDELAH